jgi:hypothetical protein
MANVSSLSKTDSVVLRYRAKVTAAGKIENKAELFAVDQIDNKLANNTSVYIINDFSTANLVGLSKAVGEIKSIGTNKYEVPFKLIVSNMGSTNLVKVNVSDDLDKTFGSGAVIMDSLIAVNVDSGYVSNAKYTGRGTKITLLADSVNNLAVGKKFEINFKVKVDLSKATSKDYFNSADVYAGPTGAVKDKSNTGLNADPDNDGNPTNNDEPTAVKFGSDTTKPAIATALSIIDSSFIDALTYEVKLRALIKNIGKVKLTNIGLIDSLSRTFPDSVKFTIMGTPNVSVQSKLKVNPSFDGTADVRLLLPDSSATLIPGQIDTVFYTVRIKYLKNYGPYFVNTQASGKNGTVTVTDVSNTGTEIKPELSTPTIIKIPKDPNPTSSLVDAIVITEGLSPNGDGQNDNLQ